MSLSTDRTDQDKPIAIGDKSLSPIVAPREVAHLKDRKEGSDHSVKENTYHGRGTFTKANCCLSSRWAKVNNGRESCSRDRGQGFRLAQ